MNTSKNVRALSDDWNQTEIEENKRITYVRLMKNWWFSTKVVFIGFTIIFASIAFVLPLFFLQSPNRK